MVNPYSTIDSTLFTQNAGTRLEINLSALIANYQYLSQKAKSAKCAAVIKADSYSLGMLQVAQALKKTQCKDFFVAYLDEGIALRSILDENYTIYILNGLFPYDVHSFIKYNLTPVLNDMKQIKLWNSLCEEQGKNYPAVIQFDTGMSRFGIDISDLIQLQNLPFQYFKPIMVMSHLACADEPSHLLNQQQLESFQSFQRHFPNIPASLSASSGIFLGEEWHFDLVRPGAALYGINPTPYTKNPMNSVVSLYSKIIQIRQINKGTSVGYGASFTTDRKLNLAIVSIGYADGFLRLLSNKIKVRHRKYPEIPLPVIGRISMDCLCIDISDLPYQSIQTNDEIELIGPNCPIEVLANTANTIGYEILTALGNRFYRTYT